MKMTDEEEYEFKASPEPQNSKNSAISSSQPNLEQKFLHLVQQVHSLLPMCTQTQNLIVCQRETSVSPEIKRKNYDIIKKLRVPPARWKTKQLL